MGNIQEARALLTDDNLVWSDDFERIREPLARLLAYRIDDFGFRVAVNEIADAIVEADVTAPDPTDECVWDAARQLGIIDQLAQRSKGTADALKRLFSRL